jgi:hypothetical protein
VAYRPAPEEDFDAYFAAKEAKEQAKAQERKGFGRGLRDVLLETGRGFIEQLAPITDPFHGARAIERAAIDYATRTSPELPQVTVGRPETREEAIPPETPTTTSLRHLGGYLPNFQFEEGLRRFLQSGDQRYLSQFAPGPMQEGQERPVQVMPMGQLPPEQRGYEAGAGAGQAGVGAGLMGAMAAPGMMPRRPPAIELEGTRIPGPAEPWWAREELPAAGTPSRIPPERGLPPPAAAPGGPEGLPPPGGPRPGAGGRTKGGSYKFSMRFPNGLYAEFAVDAATEMEAVSMARAAMPPNVRDFFDRAQPQILYQGEAKGQQGIYDFTTNDPRYARQQARAQSDKTKQHAAWEAYDERVDQVIKRGRGHPGPPPPFPRVYPRGEGPGRARPQGAPGAQAPPRPKEEGPPKEKPRAARPAGAKRPAEEPKAKAEPQAAPEEAPIQRVYREKRDRLRKEFEEVHGYAAPDYAQISDLEAMIRSERAAKAAPSAAKKAEASRPEPPPPTQRGGKAPSGTGIYEAGPSQPEPRAGVTPPTRRAKTPPGPAAPPTKPYEGRPIHELAALHEERFGKGSSEGLVYGQLVGNLERGGPHVEHPTIQRAETKAAAERRPPSEEEVADDREVTVARARQQRAKKKGAAEPEGGFGFRVKVQDPETGEVTEEHVIVETAKEAEEIAANPNHPMPLGDTPRHDVLSVKPYSTKLAGYEGRAAQGGRHVPKTGKIESPDVRFRGLTDKMNASQIQFYAQFDKKTEKQLRADFAGLTGDELGSRLDLEKVRNAAKDAWLDGIEKSFQAEPEPGGIEKAMRSREAKRKETAAEPEQQTRPVKWTKNGPENLKHKRVAHPKHGAGRVRMMFYQSGEQYSDVEFGLAGMKKVRTEDLRVITKEGPREKKPVTPQVKTKAPRKKELPEYITENRGRWFTDSARKAGGYGHRQYFVDVPEDWTPDYGGDEYVLPKEYVSKIKPLSEAGPVPAGFKRLFRGEGRDEAPVSVGRATKVRTPSKDYEVQYEEVPLSSITPSHNPITFAKSKGYPFEQQRDYSTSKAEQLKVIEMARTFDPEFVFSDDPTATSGPPIVSQEGYVLGGNARTMSILRRLEDEPLFGLDLKVAVQKARKKFDIESLGSNEHTIIVRRVGKDLTLEQQRVATKHLNEDQKKEVDPTDLAISRGQQISQGTVDWLSEQLAASGETLRGLLGTNAGFYRQLMERFSDEGITHSGELPRFLDEQTGKLNDAGLKMVEETVLGRVVRSPKLLRFMRPNLRALFINALTDLARAEAQPADWNLRPSLIDGLAIHERAVSENKTADMVVQPRLDPDPFLDAVKGNKLALALARWFDDNAEKPNALRTAIKKYEGLYQDAVGKQGTIDFVERLAPHEAFNRAFGAKLKPEDFATGSEGVYMYDIGGALGKALNELGKGLSSKAQKFADWLLVPSDIRLRRKTTTTEEMLELTMFPRTGDSFRRAFAAVVEAFLNVAVLDRPLSKFPAFREELARYNVRRTNAAKEALDTLAEALEPIRYVDQLRRKKRKGKEIDQMFIDLAKAIALRDSWNNAVHGMIVPEFAEPQYKGWKEADIVKDLERRAERAERHAHPDALESRERLYDLMTALRKEMVDRGKVSPKDRLGRYYWPHIYDESRFIDQLHLSPQTPEKIKEAVRRYTKRRRGTVRQHEPNFLVSGIHHYLQVILDNLLDDFAHEVGRTWDVAPKVIASGENLKDIKIPLDYVAYHVRRGKYGWDPQTMAEFKILMEMQKDGDIGMGVETFADVEAMYKIHTGHDRLVYVIPREVAAKLEKFREPRGGWDRFASHIRGLVGRWKGWILSQLGSRYQLENLIGDWTNIFKLPGFDKVSLGGVKIPVPTGAATFKHLPAAVRDALQMAYGDVLKERPFEGRGPIAKAMLEKATGKYTRPSARLGYQVGIAQQTYGAVELADLRKHPTLDVFTEPKRGILGKVAASPFKVIDKWLDIQRLFTIARESVPRQMTWLYLLSKEFSPERASRVVNRELIDYGNVSELNRIFRDTGIAPFITWYYQNFPNWVRAATGSGMGMPSELDAMLGGQGGGVKPPQEPPEGPPGGGFFGSPEFVPPELERLKHRGELPRMGLRNFAMVFGVPMLMWWLWNEMDPEANEQVDPWSKLNMTTLQVGKLTDGRPIYLAWNSPLDAALGFLGISNPLERAQRILTAFDRGEGGKALARQAAETAVAPAATVGGMLGPTVASFRYLYDASRHRYRELWQEDPEIDRWIDSWFTQFVQDNTPYVSQWRGITREDLEDEPAWLPLFLSPSPFSLLLKVPLTDEERKRRRKKPRASGRIRDTEPSFGEIKD